MYNYIEIIGVSLSEPHISAVHMNFICLDIYLSVHAIIKDVVLIYGVPLIVDCSVEDLFCALLCVPTFNKHCGDS